MKITMAIGIFIGNLLMKRYYFGTSWTEAIYVAAIAMVVFSVFIFFIPIKTE